MKLTANFLVTGAGTVALRGQEITGHVDITIVAIRAHRSQNALTSSWTSLKCTYHVHVHRGGRMATATERIVVQVTAVQKRAIASTAKRLGLNVSELMRQAAQGFTPSEDEQDMHALIARVNASTNEANDALDDALAFVAESNRRIAVLTEGKH